MCEAIHFENFDVLKDTGLALEITHSLPNYYQPWHDLASKTISLMSEHKMRTETQKLPLLDSSKLVDFKDLRLAHLQLVVITAGYAWEQGPEHLPPSIPANVAVPLCEIADKLGAPSGMSYFVIMTNWTRIDKQGPFTRQNIKPLYMMPGGDEYVGFLSLAVQMEVYFVQAFPALQTILTATNEIDEVLAISGLRDLLSWLKEFQAMAKDFHNVMTAEIFFRVIVSFLRGFNETSGLPEGMLYEGVTERPRRIILNSAASQAAVFQILDAILGIEYNEDKLEFFRKLRTTWCEKHRELYEKIKNWPGSLRNMATTNSDNELALVYNEFVEAVKQFRSYHVQLVTKYTVMPYKRLRNELKDEGPDQTAYLLPLLKGIRDTSESTKLDI